MKRLAIGFIVTLSAVLVFGVSMQNRHVWTWAHFGAAPRPFVLNEWNVKGLTRDGLDVVFPNRPRMIDEVLRGRHVCEMRRPEVIALIGEPEYTSVTGGANPGLPIHEYYIGYSRIHGDLSRVLVFVYDGDRIVKCSLEGP